MNAAGSSSPSRVNKHALGLILGELKAGAPYFSLDTIRQKVSDAGLTLKDVSLKVYLSEAVKLGRIHDAGRGWYSGLSTRATLDPHPVAKLIRAVEKAFPLLDFTVWSTVQMNPWMHHLLAKPIHFLNAPVETLESVGEALRESGWDVSVNPTPSEASRQVRPGEKCVVLRPALARAPQGTGRQAVVEAVLVDWWVESAVLGFTSGEEASDAIKGVVTSSLLELSSIQRYAESRKVDFSKIEPLTFVTKAILVTKVND